MHLARWGYTSHGEAATGAGCQSWRLLDDFFPAGEERLHFFRKTMFNFIHFADADETHDHGKDGVRDPQRIDYLITDDFLLHAFQKFGA